MKTLPICFICLLLSSINYAQKSKIAYVDDVETVEIITIEVCFNDDAVVDKVTIINDLTSYNNQEMIDKIKRDFIGKQGDLDGGYQNNCYTETAELINKKYQNASISESNWDKCKKFQKGKFKYLDLRYADAKIKRNNKKQVEESDSFKAEYKLDWVTPCQYNMTYTKVREEKNKSLLGKTIYVNIIGLLEDSYIYKANFENEVYVGEIKKQ
ncbi:hypothetical protein [Meridianimaribacter flavus]|uniref:PDDEXK-like uncharacterized protein n=1 Tax=Meridianimaribacter flavus TaxID=571115 RepID=A0ABY2G7I4_9FLAO|nr:hypothetical protein [Meridianimaribacter flavus]TDY12332.1 PDDEXK-like uncharacterized protein [Meridianimaribacter flavus]